jgi:hypothetical protein
VKQPPSTAKVTTKTKDLATSKWKTKDLWFQESAKFGQKQPETSLFRPKNSLHSTKISHFSPQKHPETAIFRPKYAKFRPK